MLGAVRYADSGALFDRAKIFLNTSSIEGFPNTFLQAWIRGVPVVSFFDPDSLVQRLPLGHIANSVDDMREAIRGLLEDDVDRAADRAPRARIRHARIHHAASPPVTSNYWISKSPQMRLGTARWTKPTRISASMQGADLP